MPFSLLAAVPSHSGSMIMEGTQTIVDAQNLVLGRGGSFRFHWEGGSTVSLVRNAIAAEFLQSSADLLLMLDADQAIHPDTLDRMIAIDQPVVGCIYPRRGYDWSTADFKGTTNPRQLLAQAQHYVGAVLTDEGGSFQVIDGCAKAAYVGTGILLVRRGAFEKLMEHFPDLERRGFSEDAYPQYAGSGRWGFFNPIDNEEGVPLSEDISFCLRWRDAGGEIWADVTSTTMHVGRHTFTGALIDHLHFSVPEP